MSVSQSGKIIKLTPEQIKALHDVPPDTVERIKREVCSTMGARMIEPEKGPDQPILKKVHPAIVKAIQQKAYLSVFGPRMHPTIRARCLMYSSFNVLWLTGSI